MGISEVMKVCETAQVSYMRNGLRKEVMGDTTFRGHSDIKLNLCQTRGSEEEKVMQRPEVGKCVLCR